MYAKYWKNNTAMEKAKDEAGEAFKTGEFASAIELYTKCLEFDQLNAQYNQTVLFNRACALNRIGQNE